MGVRAIDVSRWQGTIDWNAVRSDGVAGAWIKVGGADGGLYRDSRAAANLAGARAAGLPFGTYYFCSAAVGNAVSQARHAVDCGHGQGDLWPMADLETNPHGLSHEQLDEWLTEFCAEVHRLVARESIWYGGYGTGVGYTAAAPRCPVWVANYGTNAPSATPPAFSPRVPPQYAGWDIWQFNSTTHVAGISGSVDQNVITDAFWARMTAPSPEEDDMAPPVILTTTPGSVWGTREAGIPGDGVASFLAYPSSGIAVWVRSPDHLNLLRALGVEDRGPTVDDILYNFTFQPHNGRAQAVDVAPVVAAISAQIAAEGVKLGIDPAALDQLVARVTAADREAVGDELAERLKS